MKKLMMTALLTALVGTASAQQKATTPEQRSEQQAQKRTAELTSLLGLTPEQSAAVVVLTKEQITSLARVRSSGLAGEALREEMKVINQNYDDGLKATLTEEQLARMPNHRKEQQREVATPDLKSE